MNVKASGRGRIKDWLRELMLLMGVYAIRKQSVGIGMRNRVGCRGTRRDSYLSDNISPDIPTRVSLGSLSSHSIVHSEVYNNGCVKTSLSSNQRKNVLFRPQKSYGGNISRNTIAFLD